MPTVPNYDTAQVNPGSLSGGSMQGLGPRQLLQGEIAGEQIQKAGQDTLTMGAQDADAAAKQMALANEVRKDSGLNDLRGKLQFMTFDPENGYLSKTGQSALQPNAQGQSLADQYTQQAQQAVSQISQGLGNDAQRRVFQQQASALVTQFQGQIQQHILKESVQFGLQTQQGTVDLATDAAAKNWNNPDVVNQSVSSIQSAIWKAGQIAGTPANLIQAQTEAATSKMHLQVIDAALQNNNPQYASMYINQYKDGMTAGDLLKAQGAITKDMDARVATGTAMAVIGKYQSSFAPTDYDRAFNIAVGRESGGQQFGANGAPLTSSKGAVGIAQVMPATGPEAAKLANLPWDPQRFANDASYNKALGQAYFMQQVRTFNGDVNKAWAAYNAGPGAVQSAIQKAGAGGNWLALLPKETQQYVQANAQKFNTGGGTSPMPSLMQLQNEAVASLGPNADPRTVSATQAEVKRQYGVAQESMKTQGDNAVQQAQQWLIQNGGNFAAMPPDLKSSITSYAPDQWDKLQKFAEGVANPPKASNMAAYHLAFEHPDELAKMSDAMFNQFVMTNFDPNTQKEIQKLRMQSASGTSHTSENSINVAAIRSGLANRLSSIGIDASPKDDAGKQRIGAIQKFITDGISEQQKQLGRKMAPDEILKYVDQQFNRNFQFQNTVFGIGVSHGSMPYLSMQVNDIPSKDVDQIKAALAKQGNYNPSNDLILRAYWAKKVRSNG